ncbi:MAG TPA: ribonuclease catalytic domain-containing protein [Candidatus Polarisedimenticolaceae bacterium]
MREGIAPGAIVAWWRGGEIAFAVYAGDEKQRVSLIGSSGREDRVPEARLAFAVEPSGRAPGKSLEDRRAAAERVALVEARARAEAAAIDVATVWDLARGSGVAWSESDLADLAVGRRTGEARAALVVALVGDGVHFIRRPEGWQAREPEAVEEILDQNRRSARRGEEKRAALEALRRAGAGEPYVAQGSEVERRYLSALEAVALDGDEADEKERDVAREAIEASGIAYDRAHEAAFRLLRRVGVFEDDDENLDVRRYGLRLGFPDEVLRAADEAAQRGFPRAGREDLVSLVVWTIDGPRTREVDDALSVERLDDGGFRVGVHIADPAAFVAPGDPVDLEAIARGTTFYFPDARLPMLPPAISERAASLVPGEERPALSFLAEVGGDGSIGNWRVVRSIVKVAARLDYEAADASIVDGSGRAAADLRALLAAADLREGFRARAGAVRLRAVETEIVVAEDGTLVLERRDTGTPAHRLVSEAMVLAGELAARFASERGIPAIYRRQAPPEGRLPQLSEPVVDPRVVRSVRRLLRRGEAGLTPGRHYALGLEAYAQATSPLRRYQDLVAHRQIGAALRGERPPYDAPALQRVAATTERAEAEARRAERSRDRYWMLRWFAERTGSILEGIVVETQPRPVVLLDATCTEEVVPGLAAAAGERVEVRVIRANPRADLLVLR